MRLVLGLAGLALGACSASPTASPTGSAGKGAPDASGRGGATGSAGTGGATGAAGAGTTACVNAWARGGDLGNPNAKTTFVDGALLLEIPLEPEVGLYLGHHANFVDNGDVDVAIDFEAFMPAGGNVLVAVAFRVANVGATDHDWAFAGMVADGGSNYVRAALDFGDVRTPTQEKLTATTAAKGTARLQKTGSTILVTSRASSGETATLSVDVLRADAVAVDLLFGNVTAPADGGIPAGVASVRITDFRMTDGAGTVSHDAFDCDSTR